MKKKKDKEAYMLYKLMHTINNKIKITFDDDELKQLFKDRDKVKRGIYQHFKQLELRYQKLDRA